MEPIDFSGTFAQWKATHHIDPHVLHNLAYAGVALLLWTLAAYGWKNRRGRASQDDSRSLLWTLGLGCALVAPMTVLPLVLVLVDWAANTFLAVLRWFA